MEENKVAERVRQIVHEHQAKACKHGDCCAHIAEALIQAPDLRITIHEPRYEVMPFRLSHPDCMFAVVDVTADKVVARFHVQSDALAYVNSKEPKWLSTLTHRAVPTPA